ncbi:hypothetical protein JOQ06_013143 [Pogonophryne albipinna]|uniref:Uncharacterized protein n=1 Tax=Pogonophryne albipinna TaxID=1090488 RepID=A0AAD6FSV5_9TELE|nr:hypothetical protein JOQ06_013143 [Pogonophryne albipinna]
MKVHSCEGYIRRHLQRMRSVFKCVLFVPITLCAIYLISLSVKLLIGFIPMEKCHLESAKMLNPDSSVDASLNLQSRPDVQTCTYWKAAIIWEGMFDPRLYDEMHKMKGSSVALTVFAVGRYLDAYLHTFLNSAEQHFMVGLPVTYYVFTDMPEKVPNIKLSPLRSMKVIKVEKNSRWQDVSMMRMKSISDVIESDIRHHCTHVFCFDVDQYFYTYDRNPNSKAYMETGDFYYHAAIFGGSWKNVKALTQSCYQGIVEDKQNNVEALWHDESHLNKYMLLHKPSKVLSPEYCWDTSIGFRRDIQVTRLLWAPKYYDTLRTP